MNKIALTLKEARDMTGISRSAWYRIFADGKVVPRKQGKRVLIMRSDLEAYLASLPPAKYREAA